MATCRWARLCGHWTRWDIDGVIDFDHPVGITGEGRLPKQYISFAVGYMRGLLHNL